MQDIIYASKRVHLALLGLINRYLGINLIQFIQAKVQWSTSKLCIYMYGRVHIWSTKETKIN